MTADLRVRAAEIAATFRASTLSAAAVEARLCAIEASAHVLIASGTGATDNARAALDLVRYIRLDLRKANHG